MQIVTHQNIDRKLCGDPIEIGVDGTGLTHGGFIFGLADHAAMIAVNHPNVVLGSAEVKFLKPVKAGDRVEATAKVTAKVGKKQTMVVTVATEAGAVFEGVFGCFTLDTHVLKKR